MSHNCNTCLSRESCYHWIEYGEGPYHCDYYKDESLYIKSPVAIGDTVYIRVRTDRKDPSQFFINPAKVTGLHLKDGVGYRGISRKQYFIVRSEYGMAQHIPFDWIGKSVFFTCKEAEQGYCDPREG